MSPSSRARSARGTGKAASAETVRITQLGADADSAGSAEASGSASLAAEGSADAPTSELSAEELLSIPPRADNLAVELAARPPRARLPRVTLALSAGILIALGFVGGVLAQKHYGGSSGAAGRTSALASSFAAARGTGAGAGAGRGRFGGGAGTGTGAGTGAGAGAGAGAGGFGGNSITGSITVVSGDTLYITASDGTVYTVKASGSTTVKLSSSGSLSQLKPGQTVTISGSQGSGGTVNATTITAGN